MYNSASASHSEDYKINFTSYKNKQSMRPVVLESLDSIQKPPGSLMKPSHLNKTLFDDRDK